MAIDDITITRHGAHGYQLITVEVYDGEAEIAVACESTVYPGGMTSDVAREGWTLTADGKALLSNAVTFGAAIHQRVLEAWEERVGALRTTQAPQEYDKYEAEERRNRR